MNDQDLTDNVIKEIMFWGLISLLQCAMDGWANYDDDMAYVAISYDE